jgi:hypothetical protein
VRPYEECITVGEKPVTLQLRSLIQTLPILYTTIFLENDEGYSIIFRKRTLQHPEHIAG